MTDSVSTIKSTIKLKMPICMKIYDTNHSKKVICYFLDMLCCCKAAGMECDNDDVDNDDDDDDDDELFFRNG